MKDIYTFKFWKHKYGPELLVDIVDYAAMLPPIRRHTTFTETFYSITIVLDADETVAVDGVSSHIIRSFGKRYSLRRSNTVNQTRELGELCLRFYWRGFYQRRP